MGFHHPPTMSLFVHVENQKILWNAINTSPLFKEFNVYPKTKEQWFKEMMQFLYENQPSLQEPMTYENLQIINRNVVGYMMNQIKNSLSPPPPPPAKTTEYDPFFKKKENENIDFSNETDTPISNMDELIEQHLKQRNEELQKIVKSFPNVPVETIKINNDPLENIRVETELHHFIDTSLTKANYPIKSSLKKNGVHFQDEYPTPTHTSTPTSLEKIKEDIEKIKEDLGIILQIIQKLQPPPPS